jgi:pimeloyl-ACP methyl ester carboxylesterase
VLDAYAIPAAHLVGVSAGGALAQLLALGHPERVRSLVLISTSFAVSTDRDLPAPAPEFSRFVANVDVDWSDPESVIDYLVEYSRVVVAGQRPFDEVAAREFATREVERARDFAAAQNHDLLGGGGSVAKPLSAIAFPTLVVHGTADPMFPIGHGQALADEIPDARLLPVEGAGHLADRADPETVARAILSHTRDVTVSGGAAARSRPAPR